MGRVSQNEPRTALKVGVAFPLLLKDRHWPAVGAGLDRFVVPIRPFHQADPHRRAALTAPIPKRDQVALGIAKVALQHDADIRPVAELRLTEDGLEDFERESLFV